MVTLHWHSYCTSKLSHNRTPNDATTSNLIQCCALSHLFRIRKCVKYFDLCGFSKTKRKLYQVTLNWVDLSKHDCIIHDMCIYLHFIFKFKLWIDWAFLIIFNPISRDQKLKSSKFIFHGIRYIKWDFSGQIQAWFLFHFLFPSFSLLNTML